MHEGLAACPARGRGHRVRRAVRRVLDAVPRQQQSLRAVVGREEERGAWGRPDDCAADTGVDAAEAAGAREAGGGLEACF